MSRPCPFPSLTACAYFLWAVWSGWQDLCSAPPDIASVGVGVLQSLVFSPQSSWQSHHLPPPENGIRMRFYGKSLSFYLPL
eukprot:g28917.t1